MSVGPVSGPQGYTQRVNAGQDPSRDPAYGDGVTLQNLKAGAPLAQTASSASAAQAPAVDPFAAVPGFGTPTQQPETPITAGAAAGAGPGPEVLGLPQDEVQERTADARALLPAVQSMIVAASRPDATPSFKRYVRTVVYNLR
jgi:hypothetical protein